MDGRLSDVVLSGDIRRSLAALRDYLADALDAARVEHCADCRCECGPPPPRASDIAALSARLTDVLLRLDKMAGPQEVSGVDELRRRREARVSGAAGKQVPAVPDVSG